MRWLTRLTAVLLSVVLVLIISGCGGSSSPHITQPPPHLSTWTWVSGANTSGQIGVYGTQGTASSSNVPGARALPVSWIDAGGNLWLFGGLALNSQNAHYDLNDLWKFDGNNWTWVSGANVVSQPGVYGTQGTASPSNVPGARSDSVSWIDRSGNLWLFGGSGIDSAGTQGDLSDLWKFDGNNWTWVSGANVVDQPGVYGTQGTASPSNVPGARWDSVSWIDRNGNLWLFGGNGIDSAGTAGDLNDLWKFDGSNWTWISGANVVNQQGVYGTQGIASSSNVPGAREGSASLADASGNLWLFGGGGVAGFLNDLWKFDGRNWVWISGASTNNQAGAYGTRGTASPSNVPGGRRNHASWIDGSGNFWFFGGSGLDSLGATNRLNDLWKFDGSNWTWVGGANTIRQVGTYGTRGTASASNVPGARAFAISWIDSRGNLWLFGGNGIDSAGTQGDLNDLWRYTP
jgi:N-acetylneuraminic acid mutarotase